MRHNQFTVKQCMHFIHTHRKTLNANKRDEVLQPHDAGEESTQLICLNSQFPNWLIHLQELESVLGTKFLQKGCWILR